MSTENNGTRPLLLRQEQFCAALVADPTHNQARAAIAAGYAAKNAAWIAHRLMRDPRIVNRVRDLGQQALEDSGYSTEALRLLVIRKLVGAILTDFSDVAEVVYPDDARRKSALSQRAEDHDGQYLLDFGEPIVYVKPSSEWTEGERFAVKSVERNKDGLSVTLHDKLAAIKILSDIIGLTKSASIDLQVSLADEISVARERALSAIGSCANDDGSDDGSSEVIDCDCAIEDDA